jgi:hypothetical protein
VKEHFAVLDSLPLGQIIFTQKVSNVAAVTLDISPFAKGFYLIRIGNKTAKIMKQ